MFHTILALALAAGLNLPVSAQDLPISTKVVSLTLTKQLDDQVQMLVMVNPGVTLSLLLRSEGRSIVGIDRDASSVSKFVDAAGNDLLKAPAQRKKFGAFSGMMMDAPIGMMPRVSDDGTLAVVELKAPNLPAANSASLSVGATIVVDVASGTKTQTIPNVALTPGKLATDGPAIEIKEIGQAQWGDAKLVVTLKMSATTDKQLADVRFLNAAGKDITSGRLSSMTMMNTAEIEYGLKEKVDTATIELIFHDQMETVRVPVELQVTLGL